MAKTIDLTGGGDAAVAAMAAPVAPVAVAEPEGGWPLDAFSGQPGSYVRDPVTGLRSPMPGDPQAAQVAAQVAQDALAAQVEDKRVAALQAAAKAKP